MNTKTRSTTLPLTGALTAAGLMTLFLLTGGWAEHPREAAPAATNNPPQSRVITGKVVSWQVRKDGRVLFAVEPAGAQNGIGEQKGIGDAAPQPVWIRTNPDLTIVTHVEELVLDTVREVARTQVDVSAKVDAGDEDGATPKDACSMSTLSWHRADVASVQETVR